MKLLSYQGKDGQRHLGALQHERIVNLHRASDAALPDDMLEFLQLGSAAMESAHRLVAEVEADIALDSVKLLAPIVNPQKVVAIGLNYMDHVREAGFEVPEIATMFCKYPSAIIASGDVIRWSRQLTQQVDYEAELALSSARQRAGSALLMLTITSPDIRTATMSAHAICNLEPATSGCAVNAWTVSARWGLIW